MTGQVLRNMRKKNGLSQWQVAKALSRSQGFISNIELGYQEPSEEVLLDIAGTIKSLASRTK